MTDEPTVTRADLLATVERSPAAIVDHDRAGWLGLFTADGLVEDPVGARPHRGPVALGRFYDTFIGPRTITFRRDADIVVGNAVVRDLELEVAMAPELVMRIPAYLRYDVHTDGDQLKIARLQAHWELPTMMAQFAGSGLAAAGAGLALSRGLLGNQGVSGTLGFLSGFGGVGARGKRHLAALVSDAVAGDELAVRRTIGDSADVTLGDGVRLGTSEFVARLAGARHAKVIAAGYTVAVGVERDGRRGVIIAEMRGRPLTILSVRLFVEE